MNNTLLGNIKVGDLVTFCYKTIEIAKIQKGYPTSFTVNPHF